MRSVHAVEAAGKADFAEKNGEAGQSMIAGQLSAHPPRITVGISEAGSSDMDPGSLLTLLFKSLLLPL